MRLMVSAGGTGGGIYPALAVLQALGDKPEEVLWVGGVGGMEADLVRRAGVPFKSIPAAGLHGVGLKAVGNTFQLVKGYFAARRLIAEFRPDVLFFTGGYVAIPTGFAGRNVPMALCLPDIEPNLALKTLSRFAAKIAVPVEESRKYFANPEVVEVVGYPTRLSLTRIEKNAAVAAFDLDPQKPVLLVTGGSLGARSINQAVVAILPELLSFTQVIHLTGERTWPEVEAATTDLTEAQKAHYRPFRFLHEEMNAAFSAADLVVSRGGGSVLGELPEFGLPAILVPYPYAWDTQIVNSEYLASRGGAMVIRDQDLGEQLLPALRALLQTETARRMEMQTAMQSLVKPGAAEKIAAMLLNLTSSAPADVKGMV
ncbi:undecaprenyldiphospho-muramoylpentapeptide beta-N-acetylglucosaminyltransferase [bacterium]|nr:undecaprenyldiphospho-muramoylpentapeptide beta-N-acetylglucosaminyltransferase [bacterium]MCB2179359.1 undecaprenyldiphospho-muramoylpentapeptide beta-N-acetylglucosaminyltransferase [bacterium]